MKKITQAFLLGLLFLFHFSIANAANEKLWVNTYAGALGITLDTTPQPHAIPSGYDIAIDQTNGNVWAYDGLSLLSYSADGSNLNQYPINVYGANSHLLVDSDIGNVWLSIENKLYIFDLSGALLKQVELPFNNFKLELDKKHQHLYLSDDFSVYVYSAQGDLIRTVDLQGYALRAFTYDVSQENVLVLAGDKILRFDTSGALIFEAADSKLDCFHNLSADGKGGFWSSSYSHVYHYDQQNAYDFEAIGFKGYDYYGEIGTILTMVADPVSDTVWLGSYYDVRQINLQNEELYALNTYLFEGVERQIFKMKMYYGDGDSSGALQPEIEVLTPANNSVFRETAPVIELAYSAVPPAVIDVSSLSFELNQVPVSLDCTSNQSAAQCQFVSFPGIGSHILVARISDTVGEVSTPASLQFEIGLNALPVITSTPTQTVFSNNTYIYDVDASDADGDVMTYTLTAAPASMQIDTVSGLISWSTLASDIGSHLIEITVTDSFGASVTQNYTLVVEQQLITVPDLVGATQIDAEQAIIDGALTLGSVSNAFSSTVPQGTVISQTPVAGSAVNPGAMINLVVSAGPELTIVPSLINTQVTLVEDILIGASLALGTQSNEFSLTVPAGRVISQQPVAGDQVEIGVSVDIVVSQGLPPVLVPSVIGQAQTIAQTIIMSAGLTVGTMTTANSDTVAAGNVISQSPVAGISVATGSVINLVISSGPAPVITPNVVGQAQASAESAITSAGLTVGTVTTANSDTVAAGNVISQTPTAGSSVAADSAVNLVVSSGPAPVITPNVVGQLQASAESTITSAGLTVGTVTTANSDTVAAGNVISQTPTAGSSVAAGSAVNLVVSSGPAPVITPNVVGQLQASAETAITTAGLTVGTVTTANSDTVAAGNVISQNPTSGTSVAAGSAVNLVVSSGPAPVITPNVVGQLQASAETAITTAGLTVGTVTTANSDTVAAGNVISQTPTAGSSVAAGSAVNLVVSSGPAPVITPNVVGQLQASAETAITSAGLTVGTVTTANSDTVAAGNVISQTPTAGSSVAAGSAVNLVVSSGPAPVITPDVVGQLQASAETAITTAGLTVGTVTTANSDTVAAGNVISQTPTAGSSVAAGSAVNLVISSGPVPAVSLPLDVNVSSSPQIINQGDSATITVASVGGIAPVNIALTVDGTSVSLNASGQYVFTSTQPGTVQLVASAADSAESVETRDFISVREPADTAAPVVSITSPVRDTEITSPVDIIGTASDANLAEYTLEISSAGKNQFTEIGFGYSQVVNAALGVFDPSLYTNGLYDIRLTAIDVNGLQTTTTTTYRTSGDLKVGNFSITVNDINIPVAGIPITVNRTYDTRRKSEDLDFGYGWSIDYQDVKVEENKILGLDWRQTQTGGFFPTYCIEPNGENIVSITLPDGRVEEFELSVSPRCQQLIPPTDFSPVFTGINGTVATLTDTTNTVMRLNGGRLFDMGALDTYDPSNYQLTTVEGDVYSLNQNFGISRVQDRNGNTLSFSSSGITHSSGKSLSFNRDAQGRITSITDPNGGVIEYSYNTNGDLESVLNQASELTQHRYNRSHGLVEYIDPAGNSPARNEYDDSGRLIAQIDATGNRVEYTHDVDGRQDIVRDRNGNQTIYTYDDNGYVLSEVDSLGNTTSFTYDAEGNVLTQTDDQGNVITNTYDARDNVLVEEDELGNTTQYTYNSNSQVTRLIDKNGNTTNYTFDSNGNPTQTTNAAGDIQTSAFDSSGNLSSLTNVNGASSSYVYDVDGNLTRETDNLGNVINYTYDGNGNQLSKSMSRTDNGSTVNVVNRKEYDSLNRVIAEVDENGGRFEWEYNSRGLISAEIDALGNRVEFEYDSRRNLIRTRYADGSESTATYDAENNKLSETDRNGNATSFEYDSLNRLVRSVFADGAVVSNTYDSIGQLSQTTDALGNVKTFQYDVAGRLIGETDALLQTTSYTYDANGNQLSVTDAAGNVTQYVYDALNRRTRTTFADGTTELVAYNPLGLRTSVTDQNGNVTTYTYDNANNLISVTDAEAGITRYSYDEMGNKTSQEDALGRITRWRYDNKGNVVSRTLPLGQTESFVYDANGNKVSHTNFNGQTILFEYDSNNLLTRKTLPEGEVIQIAYNPEGQVASEIDSRGVTSYSYDSLNRLVRVDHPDSSSLVYTYDLNGNKLSLTTASGVSTYQYDVLNRPQQVTDRFSGVTQYAYDNVGNRTRVDNANGTRAEYTYDNLNRLTQLSNLDTANAVISSYTYGLDAAGNRTSMTEDNGRTVTYAYDDVYRLTGETIVDATNGNSVRAYTYDAVGNRVSEDIDGSLENYTYDDNDRLLSDANASYLYDANGNQISKTEGSVLTAYSYTSENRLSEITSPVLSATYVYDVSGVRVEQTQDGNTVRYLVDKNRVYAQVLEERDTSNSLLVEYVYADDLILQNRSGDTHYYHYDGLGSTRNLTDDTGALTDSYTYFAFGEIAVASGSSENDYLFAGEKFDAASGQYYLRARYYNPQTGRFTSMDKLIAYSYEVDTLHRYVYAANDPVNKTDPSGNIFAGGGLAGVSFSLTSSLGTSSLLRIGSAQAGRSVLKKVLFGRPPKDLGIIGEFVLDNAINAVIANTGVVFPNKGAFGTNVHQKLKRAIESYKPLPGVKVVAEPFAGGGGGTHTGRPKKGDLGLDVVVYYKNKAMFGFELKTGRGYSRRGAAERRKRFGVDFIQIKLKVK